MENRYLPAIDYCPRYLIPIDQAQLLYLPIPKNACSSLKRLMVMIQKSIDTHTVFRHSDRPTVRLNWFEHLPKSKADRVFQEYTKCVVLRNPYDRILSGYLDKFVYDNKIFTGYQIVEHVFNTMSENTGLSVDECIQKGITFREFVHYLSVTPDSEKDQHWKSQVGLINGVEFDVYYDFTKLDLFVDNLASRLGIPVTLEHFNPSTRYPNTKYVNGASGIRNWDLKKYHHKIHFDSFYDDTEVKTLVSKIYADDFKLMKKCV